MSIGKASVEQLSRIGKPQNANAIRLALLKDGYQLGGTTEKEQYRKVTKALRVRERTRGDVLRTAPGQWALTAWYDKQEADRLRFRSEKRVQQDHIDLTKRGMRAAREKGRQIGGRLKLNQAMIDRAVQMTHDGMTMPAIARHFGVTRATIINSLERNETKGGLRYARRVLRPRSVRRPRKKSTNVDTAPEPSAITDDG
jgi:hypothetical protein